MLEQAKLRVARFRSACFLFALLSTAYAAEASAKRENRIMGVRSVEDGTTTTLQIRGSSTPTFTVYKLDNPSRVVVDVAKAALSPSLIESDSKATWSLNTWAVGQVSASEMQTSRGNLVRVVVSLSRASHYRVQARGRDVVVKVTAKSSPPAAPPSSVADAQAVERARTQAAAELREARAEAERIRKSARADARRAASKIAEADKLLSQARGDKKAAEAARSEARQKLAEAQKRAEIAARAEERAAKERAAARAAASQAERTRRLAARAAQNNDQSARRLQAQAKKAAAQAEARRSEAEKAARVAEARRRDAEAATAAAEQRRRRAAEAVSAALAQQKRAESRRDRALHESARAEASREKAERARALAKKRALELEKAAAAEEARLARARQVRVKEERAAQDAKAFRSQLAKKRKTALDAEKKLVAAKSEMRAARKRLREQEARARSAEERARRAAGDRKLSARQRDRLEAEARVLAARRDKTRATLEKQAAQLAALESTSAKLAADQKEALRRLATLREEAEAARRLREAEEDKLRELVAERRKAQREFDKASVRRRQAQTELAHAESLRDRAEKAAREAEQKRELAARETARARVRAKRIRLEAEEARRASRLALERAESHESNARQQLLAARRARQKAERRKQVKASAIAEAKEREAAARRELARAKETREEAARAKTAGERALARAQKREQEAIEHSQRSQERAARALARAREREQKAASREKAQRARAAKLAQEKQKRDSEAAKERVAHRVPAATTRVRQVDVVQKEGASRVVVALSAPGKVRVIRNRGKEAILEIPSASISKSQERTLDTSAFPGAIRAVSSYRDPRRPDRVRVVVELSDSAEGVLKRVGNTYYWDFPKKRKASAAKVAKKSPRSGTRRARSANLAPRAVASYGAASAPITQSTVAQVSKRRRKTYRGKKIDLDTRNAEFHALMRLIAEEAGVNIVVPDAIKANVTIRLRRVPWDQALDVILASKGLGYKLEGPGLYRIATRKELDQELEDKINRAKIKAESEPPRPEVFNLNYVEATSVRAQLAPLLSPKGQIEVDERTNAVIINDVTANRARIINLLTRLDTQTPQIQIEARIVEARTTFVREFGIQWGGNMSASAAGGNATGLIFPNSIGLAGAADDNQTPTSGLGVSPSDFAVNLPAAIGTGSGGGIGLSLGSVGGNVGLNLRLSALEDKGSVRIISSPKITTSSNVEAQIKSGVSIPISVVSANGAQTTFVPADLELKVRPTVSLRDCAVSMQVEVKKNEADFANTGSRGDPSIITKEAKTTILVDDGETSVIGGIYTRNNSESFSKVPLLGDLPVLGWLFKNMRKTDERSEVLVFLTPKITNREALPCQ